MEITYIIEVNIKRKIYILYLNKNRGYYINKGVPNCPEKICPRFLALLQPQFQE